MSLFVFAFVAAAGRPLGGSWEAAGKLLGGCWEAAGTPLGGCWKAAGRLLGDCWELAGRLLGGYWETVGRLLGSWVVTERVRTCKPPGGGLAESDTYFFIKFNISKIVVFIYSVDF